MGAVLFTAIVLVAALAVSVGGGGNAWLDALWPMHAGARELQPLRGVHVAVLGPFPPSMCGIAEHSSYLVQGLGEVLPRGLSQVSVIALQSGRSTDGEILDYNQSSVVKMVVDPDVPADFAAAARFLRREKVTFLLVQHEFGLYSNSHATLVAFLQALRFGTGDQGSAQSGPVPVLTVLHTVADPLRSHQLKLTRQLMVASDVTAVMTERMRQTLIRDGRAPDDDTVVQVIPHGAPSGLWRSPASLKERMTLRAEIFGDLNLGDRPICLSFGLLNWGKGYEDVIALMPAVLEKVPDAAYVVLGEPHPLGGSVSESYYTSLQALAEELGLLGKSVYFVRLFMNTADLSRAVRGADVFVAPYTTPSPVSGALPLAMSSGVPVITSRFQHASSLLRSGACAVSPGCGRLVDFVQESGAAISALVELLADEDLRVVMGARALEASVNISWPATAMTYVNVGLRAAKSAHERPGYFQVLADRWPWYLRHKRREGLLRAINSDKLSAMSSWAVKVGFVSQGDALRVGGEQEATADKGGFARHALAELVFSHPILAEGNWSGNGTNESFPEGNTTFPGNCSATLLGNCSLPLPGGNGSFPGANGSFPGADGTIPGGHDEFLW